MVLLLLLWRWLRRWHKHAVLLLLLLLLLAPVVQLLAIMVNGEPIWQPLQLFTSILCVLYRAWEHRHGWRPDNPAAQFTALLQRCWLDVVEHNRHVVGWQVVGRVREGPRERGHLHMQYICSTHSLHVQSHVDF
jgi:4-amino-4-deoxy-L-arabinose transferase-like glycosyltransferase